MLRTDDQILNLYNLFFVEYKFGKKTISLEVNLIRCTLIKNKANNFVSVPTMYF